MDTTEINNTLKDLLVDESVPAWAKVLVNCFRHLVTQHDGESNFEARIKKLEDESALKANQLVAIKHENNHLRVQVAALKDEMEIAEQYSRRNCLIFHGVPEEKGESTSQKVIQIINEKLDIPSVDINIKDIDRSHRLGEWKNERITRQSQIRNRPIIVKFKGYDSRYGVFTNKKKLKNSNIMITENLTKKRYELLKKCIVKLGKGNVWTYDGRITTKIGNKYIVINS